MDTNDVYCLYAAVIVAPDRVKMWGLGDWRSGVDTWMDMDSETTYLLYKYQVNANQNTYRTKPIVVHK